MVPGPTTLIKPDPCKAPSWESLPDLYVAEGCPPGMVCLWEEDQVLLVNWILRAVRYHDEFIAACPYVKEEAKDFGPALDDFLKGSGVPTPEGSQGE